MREKEGNFISKNLLRLVMSGDRKGFRSFYDITYPFIYRFTYYFLPNKTDCEEVVSEIYYTIWKQKKQLLTIQDLKAWLYTVSRNEAFHYIKQKKKYAGISIDDLPIELSVHTDSIDEQLIEKEMLHVYNEAISDLPERCKLIFLMVREERLKYKEIAEILSIKEGTIEQQMNIAIRKIITAVRKRYPHFGEKRTVPWTSFTPFANKQIAKTFDLADRKNKYKELL